jgi:hypothetical protein
MTFPLRNAIPLVTACCMLLVLARPATQAQTLSVTPVKLIETCVPGGSAETSCRIENLTGQAMNLHIVRKSASIPEGWMASFCVINCYSPDAVDVVETLEPNQKVDFKLDWLTAMIPAEGDIEYQFSNEAIPSDQFSYHFRVSSITSTQDPNPVTRTMTLAQNYPNPFSLSGESGVRISFTNPRYAIVSLRIFNLLGHEVRTLLSDARPAGSYSLFWDGLDNGGHRVAPGIYIYKLSAGSSNLSRRMVISR